MDKKYQVFISSTYTDLIIERQEVVEAVLNAGHIPAGMELFKAGPTQEEIIREWIEESDIYVLILGPRYGSLNEEGISYTQREYNLAKELGKPMFSIVLDEQYMDAMVPDRVKVSEFETANPKYQDFRSEVMSSLVAPINHIAEIRGKVSDSIRDIERRMPEKLEGWIKGKYLVELEALRQENKKLFGELTTRQSEVIDMQKESRYVKDNLIGEYPYDYVRRELSEHIIPIEIVEESLQVSEINLMRLEEDRDTRITKSDIEEAYQRVVFFNGEVSVLSWLVEHRHLILSTGYAFDRNEVAIILRKYIIPNLEKYSLIRIEDIPNKEVRKKATHRRIKLSEEGKKFIVMFEAEEKNK